MGVMKWCSSTTPRLGVSDGIRVDDIGRRRTLLGELGTLCINIGHELFDLLPVGS